jgi:hypothetical protein
MRPSQIVQSVVHLVKNRRPGMFWGPPGVGKSELIRLAADLLFGDEDSKGLSEVPYFRDIRAILLDPVDLRGLPSVHNGVTTWNTPDFLPTDGEGILFLDELTAAPVMVQGALYQLVLDRKIGDYTLPEGWHIIAAGNREGDGAVSNRMPTALRNRFVHVTVEANVEDWLQWANTHDVAPEVYSFIRQHANLLHDFEKNRNDHAFPTPRSWKFVSDILQDGGVGNREIEHELIEGTVGKGAAVEFSAYLRMYRDLPPIDEIFANPMRIKIPTNAATIYAMAAAVSRFITVANIDQGLKFLDRLAPEFNIMAVSDAVRRDAKLKTTKAVHTWALKNHPILIQAQ